MSTVQRLSRISLICREPERLGCFYERAFGFVRSKQCETGGTALKSLLRIPGAEAKVIRMGLGEQTIELVGIKPEAQAYPQKSRRGALCFSISLLLFRTWPQPGPSCPRKKAGTLSRRQACRCCLLRRVVLPPFKFRDPEGHPLELLAFPVNSVPKIWESISGNGFLGIDHSAISVADTSRSVSFYRRLGLQCSAGSSNSGPAQDRLDNVKGAVVEVTALAPPEPTPHVELFCYRGTSNRYTAPPGINDAAATQLVLTVESR